MGRGCGGQLPSLGYKGQGEPWEVETRGSDGGGQCRGKSQWPFQALCPPSEPGPISLPPAPNIGAIHGAPHQLPSPPPPAHFNQLPPWKAPKRRTQLHLQMWKERSRGAGGRRGRKGSLTPSLLHHPQMMKPCQRFWRGYGLGAEDAASVPSPFLSLPHPTHR